jgi:hypothetical protein
LSGHDACRKERRQHSDAAFGGQWHEECE